MSKHWPQSNFVHRRPKGRWVRAHDYVPQAPRRRGWLPLQLLGCAIAAGLAGGGLWALADGGPEPVTAMADPPAVLLPFEQADPADADWAGRAVEAKDSPSTHRPAQGSPGSGPTGRKGTRVSFGLCHVGGGANCVVDGDTFYFRGAKVRIAGIDAPETHDFRCGAEKALGDRATAELRALLNSGAVTMTSIDRDRDRYGRLLRNVAVDGADVGAAMVGAGVARKYAGGFRGGWC